MLVLVFEHFRAVDSVTCDIVLNDRQLDDAFFKQFDVGNGAACCLNAGMHIGNFFVEQFAERAADYVIGTQRVAGGDMQIAFFDIGFSFFSGNITAAATCQQSR